MQLRYFVAVAESSSFTEAARTLHVTQPALSYQIKRLENELGARVFERTSRKVKLTSDGRAFLPFAYAILSKTDEALRVMEERLGVETGEVRLGTIPSVAACVLPSVLATFRNQFPGVKIHLLEAPPPSLQESVLAGDIDLAITDMAEIDVPSASNLLEVTLLLHEEVFLLVPGNHPFAERESVTFEDLAGEELILPRGSQSLSSQIVENCRRAGFQPNVAYEPGALESVRSFVAYGLGVGVVPRMGVEEDDQSVKALPFRPSLGRSLYLARSKGYPTVAARTLMVHLRKAIVLAFSDIGTTAVPAERVS